MQRIMETKIMHLNVPDELNTYSKNLIILNSIIDFKTKFKEYDI
jgi:hypothetical protein